METNSTSHNFHNNLTNAKEFISSLDDGAAPPYFPVTGTLHSMMHNATGDFTDCSPIQKKGTFGVILEVGQHFK